MLSPKERESLAEAVREALQKAKRGLNPAASQEAGGA
jgi:hypothetical protein